ncbi:LysM peptidoglycan-binding domain-containing protein [Kurthia zopfii]|uniref:aggregation-promoting factor n=1 Tax=Kurthia zopfii TaxID=1650 RepID=UPI000F6BF29A|nr:LysM peptidoglycan-binding domain-containing protein [Kurthia zopfii]VEI06762.1 Probable peptidoglycan endopeptidase LytE precursor [Kurthia zopfii]
MKNQLIAITGALALSTVAFAGSASAKEVKIQSGDTLSKLAATHGTTVSNLKQLNGLSTDLIYAGELLEVGGNGVAPVQQKPVYQAPVKQVQTQTTYKAPAPVQKATPVQKAAPVQQAAPVQKVAPVQQAPVKKASTSSNYQGSSSSAKSWIAHKESTNNYNARSATGKYVGKYQLDRSYLKGDYSPANQERVADKYVKDRYGSWNNAKAAWQQKGWY